MKFLHIDTIAIEGKNWPFDINGIIVETNLFHLDHKTFPCKSILPVPKSSLKMFFEFPPSCQYVFDAEMLRTDCLSHWAQREEKNDLSRQEFIYTLNNPVLLLFAAILAWCANVWFILILQSFWIIHFLNSRNSGSLYSFILLCNCNVFCLFLCQFHQLLSIFALGHFADFFHLFEVQRSLFFLGFFSLNQALSFLRDPEAPGSPCESSDVSGRYHGEGNHTPAPHLTAYQVLEGAIGLGM